MYSVYKSLIHDLQYFFLFCKLSFHLFVSVLWSSKVLNFNDVQFICAFGGVSKKSLPNSKSQRDIHFFRSCIIFDNSYIIQILHLSLDVLWTNFCMWLELGSNSVLLHINIQLSLHCLLKRLFFPRWIVLAPLLKISMGLWMDSQFCSSDLYVCPYSGATQSRIL